MRSYLWGSALVAGMANANPHYYPRQLNSTSHMLFSRPYPTVVLPSSSSSTAASSSQFTSGTTSTTLGTTTSSLSSSVSTSGSSSALSSSTTSSLSSSISSSSSSLNNTLSRSATSSSLTLSNSTAPTPTNGSVPVCTGCVLEALNPITVSFNESEEFTKWTSVVVTSTILFETITYLDATVTETHTIKENKTIVGNYTAPHATITHSTPSFTFEPLHGQTITLAAGPTYVAYLDFLGGLDYRPTLSTETNPNPVLILPFTTSPPAESTCENSVDWLNVVPTNVEDFHYLIQTFSSGVPAYESNIPLLVPAPIIEYLKNDPSIQEVFGKTNIETCTLRPTPTSTEVFETVPFTLGPEPTSTAAVIVSTAVNSFWNPSLSPPPKTVFTLSPTPEESQAPMSSEMPNYPQESQPYYLTRPTETYVSTTYQSTSVHVTRDTCLRCSKPGIVPIAPTENSPEPPERKPTAENIPIAPSIEVPSFAPPGLKPTGRPADPHQRPNNPGNTITFGENTVIIKPANPTRPVPGPGQSPSPQDTAKPAGNNNIIFGSKTLTPGQVITTDGVVVSVPTDGHGSSIVVGDSTIAVNRNPGPTGPPELTVGESTVTANSRGQFVVGSKTLKPGGPAITVDGSTLSLGPSGSIAVVNGVTQTLGNVPAVTGPPVLTVKDHEISATVIGGTTAFVVAPGKTLTPGGVLTVDGTTLSLPKGGSGSTLVVNGKTTTLDGGSPVLTVNSQSITATVRDGTTEFVLGPDKTLTPGGVLTVDGTTISLPKDGSGSTIIVNGATSTLSGAGLPVMTLSSDDVTASVVDGTTVFVLGDGKTLTPGGVLTVDGTTFSLPKDGSGSTIIVNGVTSTLSGASLPVITLHSDAITASVVDGTTAFILAPGKTLTPGAVLTVDGTTFSMPASASGSVIVINGVSTTLAFPHTTAAPALTINGKTYSATVRDGTTEYVLGRGTTLKPGEAVTISGTTLSLDEDGTALVINGKTSSIPRLPASNSASTTKSASNSKRTSSSSTGSLGTTTSERAPGNFIASGLGITSKEGIASGRSGGLDKWIEGIIIGAAGWLVMML